MTPQTFLSQEPVMRALERAARAAATPLSVHLAGGEASIERVLGFGQCAACRFVANVRGGRAACEASLGQAAQNALRWNMSNAFICHMGFACTSAPLLPGAFGGVTLTMGPYCPAEEPRSLEQDARAGLAALLDDESIERFPAPLSDVRILPAAAIPSAVEWVLESLQALWDEDQRKKAEEAAVLAPAPLAPGPDAPARKKRKEGPPSPYNAAALAAAVAGSDTALVRKLLTAGLIEGRGGKRQRIAVRRAWIVAAASASMEALERAGVDSQRCLERFPGFLAEVEEARTDAKLVDAATSLLSAAHRRASQGRGEAQDRERTLGYEALNAILRDHLADGITLQEVAQRLGQSPSAITHRLQRGFGMSYSDYYGQLRVEAAKELLRRTRLNLTEVSSRIGISDLSNFRRLFRKFESMSPQEYQKTFGKKT